jgi:hypothetical protein
MNVTKLAPTLMLTFAFTGCAATSNHSLQGMQNDTARRMAADCYWRSEGERVVYGAANVYTACRRWADNQVRAQFPE